MFRELTPPETWAELTDDDAAILVDCRSPAEWHFTGVPDLSTIGKKVVLAAIADEGGRPNPHSATSRPKSPDLKPVPAIPPSARRPAPVSGAISDQTDQQAATPVTQSCRGRHRPGTAPAARRTPALWRSAWRRQAFEYMSAWRTSGRNPDFRTLFFRDKTLGQFIS